MTQEDKDLLLKDLCTRLPYKIRVSTPNKPICAINSIPNINSTIVIDGSGERVYPIKDIKPYLFPLSSMTEEQRQEYTYIVNYISTDDTDNWKEGEFIYVEQFTQLMHFYHRNHLDYRGLIPKGLALDATGLNIY